MEIRKKEEKRETKEMGRRVKTGLSPIRKTNRRQWPVYGNITVAESRIEGCGTRRHVPPSAD